MTLFKSRIEVRWFLAALLVATTLTAYSGIFQLEFIDYDDDRYIVKNERIQNGLTWEGFLQSFSIYEANWHPVTWWSHMLDFTLFGLDPIGHHLSSLLIHLINTLLLFFVLNKMTGATGRSAFVSALFALHPLHVESVAWVSERKDVLCVFFWLSCMSVYHYYSKHRGLWKQISILLFFILGLMTKPMIVTLPFFFLLLDFWPLKRISMDSIKDFSRKLLSLVLEKIPLLIFSVFSIILTLSAQLEARNLIEWRYRFGNAITSYVEYMLKTILPNNLAVFYPHPGPNLSSGKILLCLIILIGITVFAIVSIQKRSYIAVGWFWFIGTLIPVIGLIQVGSQAFADRYTYMPLNGLFLILAWGGNELLTYWRIPKLWQSSLAVVLCLALLITTRFQICHWENTHRLFEHAIKVVPGNFLAHYKLGKLFKDQGQIGKGLIHLQKAVDLAPNYPQFHFSLGNAFAIAGRSEEAIREFDKVIIIDSNLWEPHLNKSQALTHLGRLEEAELELHLTLKKKPSSKRAYNNLGLIKIRQNHFNKAIEFFRAAVALDINFAEAHNNLGTALGTLRKFQEAKIHYQISILLNPTLGEAHFNLANILTADSEFSQALLHYKEALRSKNTRAEVYHNLGALLVKLGREEEALKYFKSALDKNPGFVPSNKAVANLEGS